MIDSTTPSTMRVLLLSTLCALLFWSAGCATMTREDHQFVQFNSDPTGAEVYVDGKHVGRTPVSAPLSRKSSHNVEMRKEGYFSQRVEVKRKYDLLPALGNIGMYLLPVVVDVATSRGYSMKLEDAKLDLALNRDPSKPDPQSVALSAPAPAPPQRPLVTQVAAVPRKPPTIAPVRLPPAVFGSYHALVIGNSDYQRLPDLITAEADARAVSRVLESEYGFEVTLLLNASRSDIVSALDRLRARLERDDNLLVYYAGHGHLDAESERGYWLPVDSDPDFTANWLSNATITDTLKAIRAKHVMVVADSCYSGTLTRGMRIGPRAPADLQRMSKKRTRVVLSSGGLEPVMDSGGGGNSVFAKYFLEALAENSNVMDGTQLFGALRRPVMINAPQTPQYSDLRFAGHEGGDFLFVRRGTP